MTTTYLKTNGGEGNTGINVDGITEGHHLNPPGTENDLSGLDLTGASLVDIDLSGDTLSNAIFTGADLTNADFTGATLTGSVFTEATLDGSNFSNIKINKLKQIGLDIIGSAGDNGGESVSASEDGSIIAIGFHKHDSSRGTVRVYIRNKDNEDGWDQLGNDIDGVNTYSHHGASISLSSNGKRIAIGAPIDSTQTGRVRVFDYDEGASVWNQIGEFTGVETNNYCGRSVSLSGDGNKLAFGCYGYSAAAAFQGRVEVHEYEGNGWNALEIDGPEEESEFGYSVSLSKDGTRLAVGAPRMLSRKGRVYVYSLTGLDQSTPMHIINGEYSNDKAGYSVSLNQDGTYLAIGAPGHDGTDTISNDDTVDSTYDDRGHVRVYFDVNGDFGYNNKIFDINGSKSMNTQYNYLVGDQLGGRVSLSNDGSILAIAGRWRDTNTGAVKICQFNGSTGSTQYDEIYEILGDHEYALLGEGEALSVSPDGKRVIVGSPGNNSNGSESGKVQVLELRKSLSLVGDLTGATFVGTNLSGLDLSDTNLLGADLSGADLSGVIWTDFTEYKTLSEYNEKVTELDDMTGLRDGLQVALDTANDDLSNMTSNYNESQVDLSNMTSNYNESQADLSNMTSNYNESQVDLSNMTSNYNQSQADLSNMTSNYNQSQADLSIMTSNYNESQDDLTAMTGERDGLQGQVDNSPIDLTDDSFNLSDVLALVNNILS